MNDINTMITDEERSSGPVIGIIIIVIILLIGGLYPFISKQDLMNKENNASSTATVAGSLPNDTVEGLAEEIEEVKLDDLDNAVAELEENL